jgi:ribose transport system permease protein
MTTAPELTASDTEPGTDVRSTVAVIANKLFAKRFAGVWVLISIIIMFGIWIPDTFLTQLTLTTTLSDVAITGLIALGLMFPLLTGVIDLSVAWIAGFSMVTVSYLSAHGMNAGLAAVITLAACVGFGLVSAVFITTLKVNSLVATLGVGTVALGLTAWITGGNTITPDFGDGFSKLGRGQLFGIPLPFVYVLVLGAVMYYVLEHTPLGRRLNAVGGNPVASRLSGIHVIRLQVGVVLVSAAMSGFAGLVLAAQVGLATDSTGPAYLLPAFAAVFLGATQIKNGPNPWGTILAVVLLGAGIKGLQLLGAEAWTNDFFNGIVLLVAVAASGSMAGRERFS